MRLKESRRWPHTLNARRAGYCIALPKGATPLASLVLFAATLLAATAHFVSSQPAESGVEGVVKEKETGKPVPGAIVYLNSIGPEPLQTSTKSDDRGRFWLENPLGLVTGRFYVSGEKQGYVSHLPNYYYGAIQGQPTALPLPKRLYSNPEEMEKILGVFELPPGRIVRISIQLDKGGTLKGSLKAMTAGGLVPLTEGVILRKRRDIQKEPYFKEDVLDVALLHPDGHGEYELRDLPTSDQYFFEERFEGYAWGKTVALSIRPGQLTNLDHVVDMTNPTGITGILLRNNQPATEVSGTVMIRSSLPGSSVCFSDINEGRYGCRGLKSGPYIVTVNATDPHGNTYEGTGSVTAQQGVYITRDIEIHPAAIGLQ